MNNNTEEFLKEKSTEFYSKKMNVDMKAVDKCRNILPDSQSNYSVTDWSSN
jgi:hypothetical protein